MPPVYLPNGQQIVRAFTFDDTGSHALTLADDGNIYWVSNPIAPTPIEVLKWNPTSGLLSIQGTDGQNASLRIPRFTNATLPPAGTTGRIAYTTDDNNFRIDIGSAWQSVSIFNILGVSAGGTGTNTFTAGYVKSPGGTTAFTTQATPIPVGDGGLGIANPAAHALLLGEGTNPANALVLINGQLPIGSTGADPVAATLTGTPGNLTVANAAGSITLAAPVPGSGRLLFSSATLLTFKPFNGNIVFIPGTSKAYTIPQAGVQIANTNVSVGGVAGQNLAANTTYWLYLFDSAGALTPDFYTASAHTFDNTTGWEIRTGDNTRIFIGLVRTNGSSQFELDNTLLGVASWYNRRATSAVTATFATTITPANSNGVWVEASSIQFRINFVAFADEDVLLLPIVPTGATTTNSAWAVGLDGTTPTQGGIWIATALGSAISQNGSTTIRPTEGFHFATIMYIDFGGGTINFFGTSALGFSAGFTMNQIVVRI